MEKNIEKALDNFVDDSVLPISGDTDMVRKNHKTTILTERSGLIERIDKQYVTSDGRILLREQY